MGYVKKVSVVLLGMLSIVGVVPAEAMQHLAGTDDSSDEVILDGRDSSLFFDYDGPSLEGPGFGWEPINTFLSEIHGVDERRCSVFKDGLGRRVWGPISSPLNEQERSVFKDGLGHRVLSARLGDILRSDSEWRINNVVSFYGLYSKDAPYVSALDEFSTSNGFEEVEQSKSLSIMLGDRENAAIVIESLVKLVKIFADRAKPGSPESPEDRAKPGSLESLEDFALNSLMFLGGELDLGDLVAISNLGIRNVALIRCKINSLPDYTENGGSVMSDSHLLARRFTGLFLYEVKLDGDLVTKLDQLPEMLIQKFHHNGVLAIRHYGRRGFEEVCYRMITNQSCQISLSGEPAVYPYLYF
ncbi:MAG: hypothetical protein LBB21_01075 [Holosporaceae bacterium]|jgi:hypothetical protein|nr:hypothetical protein [Holosporaceae bacterium]